MNNKAVLGLVAAIIVLVAAFFVLHKQTPPAAFTPSVATTTVATTSNPSSVTPSLPTKAPSPAMNMKPLVMPTTASPAPVTKTPTSTRQGFITTIDQSSLASSESRPILTGTANISSVAIVIDDPQGVGIAGSFEIPVVKGHWSYSAPQALHTGTYTVHLIGGEKQVDAKLIVKLST